MSVFLTTSQESDFDFFTGLDTLNDGTTVTMALYYLPNEGEDATWAVTSVNSGTGELIPLTDFTDAISVGGEIQYQPTSIATDPATGITYVFVQGPDGRPSFLPITVATDAVGTLTSFEDDYFSDGLLNAADFDAATGELYFNYDDRDADEGAEYQLLKFTTGPTTWPTAAPQFISLAPAGDSAGIIQKALTIEHTVLAATGSELPIVAIVFLGSFAVLAGGVTVAVARRRSEAGTV